MTPLKPEPSLKDTQPQLDVRLFNNLGVFANVSVNIKSYYRRVCG